MTYEDLLELVKIDNVLQHPNYTVEMTDEGLLFLSSLRNPDNNDEMFAWRPDLLVRVEGDKLLVNMRDPTSKLPPKWDAGTRISPSALTYMAQKYEW